ncbi:hypothetical protein ACET3Z_013178 [Daucus carota]
MGGVAPFAVSGAVFREIFSGSEQFEGSHLDSGPLNEFQGKTSSSGGIPLGERVDIEDVDEDSENEGPLSPGVAEMTSANSTIHAVLRTSKHEREELYATRKRLQDALSFLRKQGFQEEQIFADLSNDGFFRKPLARDEFGLPIRASTTVEGVPRSLDDALGSKDKSGGEDAPLVFDTMPKPVPNPFIDKMKGKLNDSPPTAEPSPLAEKTTSPVKPSWKSIVTNGSSDEALRFDYCPMPEGADRTTSLLNPVQFAKMCVRYKIGDPLPEKIKVAVLDESTMELSPTEFVDVEVSYPQRPMICTGCKHIGHLVGACPVVKRVWVQKQTPKEVNVNKPNEVQKDTSVSNSVKETQTEVEKSLSESPVENATTGVEASNHGLGTENVKEDEVDGVWNQVTGRKSAHIVNATSGVNPAAQTPIYTALAKSLSKGQLKRARKGVGKNSPKKK